jgi:hypothetical protein
MLGESAEYLRCLLRRLPLAIDHLRITIADFPVVIDLGIAEIFEGERLQPGKHIFGGNFAPAVAFY